MGRYLLWGRIRLRHIVVALVSVALNVGLVVGLASASLSYSGTPMTPSSTPPSVPVSVVQLSPPPAAARSTPESSQAEAQPAASSAVAPLHALAAAPSSATPPTLPALDPMARADSAMGVPGRELAGDARGTALPLGMPEYRGDVKSSGLGDAVTSRKLLYHPNLRRYYPFAARARGVEGRTLLELQVGISGHVTAARVVQSQPAGIFDDAARRVARTLRFEPADEAASATGSTLHMELVWELDS